MAETETPGTDQDQDKKYYWIKLRTDFLADNSAMDLILSLTGGSEYLAIYLKLLLLTANNKGRLCAEFGEMLIPYNDEKIASDCKYFAIDTVRKAMELFAKMGLIYEDNDGVLTLAESCHLVGSESASREAIKKRKYREKKRLEGTTEWTEKGTKCPTEIRDKENRDKENRDKDIKSLEIEEREDPSDRSRTDYQGVIDLFNSICISYPEVKKLSEARKKAIKARLKTFSLEDLSEAFQKAEASNFLKGSNGRNWSADFDWIMKDANLAKILDGNYDNAKGKANGPAPSLIDEWANA